MVNRDKAARLQRAAEATVEGYCEERGPFVVAAEDTRMPMLFTDALAPNDPIIFANDAFLALTGFARGELMGKAFAFLVAGDGDGDEGGGGGAANASNWGRIEAAFSRLHGASVESRCRRKDGGTFSASVFISPVRDHAGVPVQYFASFIDLTRQRDEAARLERLADDLRHAKRDALTSVLALSETMLRGAADDRLVDAFKARISKLVAAKDGLERGPMAPQV